MKFEENLVFCPKCGGKAAWNSLDAYVCARCWQKFTAAPYVGVLNVEKYYRDDSGGSSDLAEGVPAPEETSRNDCDACGRTLMERSRLVETALGDLREHVDTLAEGFCARHDDTEENVLDLGRDVDELDRDVDGLRESVRLLDERQTRLACRMGDLEERVTALEENIAGLGDSCLIRDLRREIAGLTKRVLAVEWRVPYVYSTPCSVPCDEGKGAAIWPQYSPDCDKDDGTAVQNPTKDPTTAK